MKTFFNIEKQDVVIYRKKVEYINNFVLDFYDKVKEKPNVLSASSLANNMAAEPSLIPEALPAVTVPPFTKAGCREANFSSVV